MDSLNRHPGALIRKLECIVTLSDEERAALSSLPMSVKQLRRHEGIAEDVDRPSRCCVLLTGFAFQYKITSEGERQIFTFHIPGEIVDFQSFQIGRMDHSVATLIPSEVGYIEHGDLRQLIRDFPGIGAAFWREMLIDASIFRLWMVGLGRKEAARRVAHFFCEMFHRLEGVGLTQGDTCPLPMTQLELGDALGLSTVHTNRTLQVLRGRGLIALSRGTLTIKNHDRLRELGDFDPAYLHQQPREAASPRLQAPRMTTEDLTMRTM